MLNESSFSQNDKPFSTPPPSRRFAKYSPMRNKRVRFAFLVGVLLIVVLFGVKRIVDLRNEPQSLAETSQAVPEQSKGNGVIAKEFIFPLSTDIKNPKQFKFYIDKAELQNEIVIKGQKATAVKGRDFLVITLKITNEQNQAFKINTRDYVRLSTNSNMQEWLAPDIHNDPVEVQAISTKFTRVGFPVNETDRNFALQVGEIGGQKEVISLNLN